jgi:hypothetical protein
LVRFHTDPTSRKAEGRRPKALERRSGREFDLDPAHIIGPAAERVADDPARIFLGQHIVRLIGHSNYPRTDAADVEAAHRRPVEAVAQPDRVLIGALASCSGKM